MLKRTVKTAFLFSLPAIVYVIFQKISFDSLRVTHSAYASSSQYGNIEYPIAYSWPGFTGVVTLICCLAALFCLFTFSELNSRRVGGFIASLPIKKSSVISYAYLGGYLLILIVFTPVGVVIFTQLTGVFQGVRDAFALYGRPDYAEEVIREMVYEQVKTFVLNVTGVLCAYSALCFVQTLFKKPIAAVITFIGGLGGLGLCLYVAEVFYVSLSGQEYSPIMRLSRRVLSNTSLLSGNSYAALVSAALIYLAVGGLFYLAGLRLYKRGEGNSDFIFSFRTVRAVMTGGITVCTGALMVFAFIYVTDAGYPPASLMSFVFLLGAVPAFAAVKKLFNVIC